MRTSFRLGPGGPKRRPGGGAAPCVLPPPAGACPGRAAPGRGPKLKPYIISTGTGFTAFFGVPSVIEIFTSIDGQDKLSTTPSSCFSTTGISPTVISRVSTTFQVTPGTFFGTRP